MAEYIEREAAIAYAPLPKHLREYQTMNLDDAWEDGYDFAIGQIESIHAADVVERKAGKWIWDDEGYHCSECFYHAYGNTAEIYSGQYNYCPNCGAKMEG